MNAYLDGMRRYVDFRGRSTRSQFWLFTLFYLLLLCAGLLLDAMIGTLDAEGNGVIGGVVVLAHLIPSLSVLVRRLHDIDRTGWWALIMLVPLVGLIVLLVFAVTPSTSGANRFGPHPLGGADPGQTMRPAANHAPQGASAAQSGPVTTQQPIAGQTEGAGADELAGTGTAPMNAADAAKAPQAPTNPQSPTAPEPQSSSPISDETIARLERLAELRRTGAIEESEYASMKADLLAKTR
ncbi:DUF805 domain-containing protein [Pelagibacterium montanilacus]|uniref:DUF805 domain-containing protein n=1 Tax=Pelagibacterium montanilacus TaxID=2185280 RepID=UPI000F8CDB3C|nr:DUF805 domain-containing protein [Pelagibacterium montanilacus]